MRGGSAPHDDRGPEHDPVEDFFRHERERIAELPGHELHWRGIVQQARRTRPRRTGRLLAAVAAAAVLLAGG